MSMGAFGENFPYTNFHDLNMDWIVKIAKDFLDQYTNIQNTITDGLTSLEEKKIQLENLLNQWYETHSEDIANQLANAILTFQQDAYNKAQQTIASIPENYTTLSNNVTDLKRAYEQITTIGKNVFFGEWINGKGLNPDGTEKDSIRNAITTFIPVNASTQYIITCYGDSLTFEALYAVFYDRNKQFLSGTVSTSNKNLTFKTPSGCAYVRFQTYQFPTTGTGLVPEKTQLEIGSTATTYEDPTVIIKPSVLGSSLDEYTPTRKLRNDITTAVNCTITSKSGENVYADAEILYKAKSITISTNGATTSGLSYSLYGFQSGNVLSVRGSRSIGNDFYIRIQAFRENGTLLLQAFGSSGETTNFMVPNETYRIVLTIAACWGTALPANTSVTFSDIEIRYGSVLGTGTNVYTGKKIVLNDSDSGNLQRCNFSEWAIYNKSNYEAYSLQKTQGMAIYGGYMFLFKSDGGGVVVDFSTKNIVSEFSTDTSTHNNCAQFLDIYYEATDEFPMIMLSRCLGTGYDEAIVYRITRNETVFTFTQVNKISFAKDTHGLTWGYDSTNHLLIAYSLVNGTWQTTTNNPLAFWTFTMPDRSEILSGTEIILTEDDVKSFALFDYKVPQGFAVYGGIVYQAVQVGSSKKATIIGLDIQRNETLSTIPLSLVYEPEDVAIYGGKMYVNQVDPTNTYGPLWISEITF